MKKIRTGFRLLCSVFVMFVSLVFIIIEGRLLCSGDWTIYEHAYFGCMQYCLRLLLAIFSFGVGLLPWIFIKKNNALMKNWHRFGCITLVCISIVYAILGTNYIGTLFLIISILHYCAYYDLKTWVKKS